MILICLLVRFWWFRPVEFGEVVRLMAWLVSFVVFCVYGPFWFVVVMLFDCLHLVVIVVVY